MVERNTMHKKGFSFESLSFVGSKAMKCFHYFKDRTKSRVQRSAPELKSQSKYSATTDGDDDSRRIAKSSCSTAPSTRGVSELYEEKAQNLRVFRLAELKRATHSFSRLLKIGEGGFGSVYKGSIKLTDGDGDGEDDFVPVAIKKLSSTALQGHKQWVAEVQFLGIVEHENLMKLIGYCAFDGERGIQRLLVYEYMPNRSLEDHLFNNSKPPLCWDTRLNIILGAAQGLAYLHEGLEVQVIFRDFKTSNVLLDEKFKPKLSDFGLAREGPMDGNTHVSTAVMGTYGYVAPDYVETGHLTTKSDVWSFGVVLYEILTGRRSLERNLPRAEQKLLEWVKEFPPESKRFDHIMDQRLQDRYSFSGARRVARLANRCLSKSARDRPLMSQVVAELQEIVGNTEDGNPRALAASEDGSCPDADRKAEADLDQVGPTDSWKRRMAHLAKLGDGVEVAGRRRFMIAQRAQVN